MAETERKQPSKSRKVLIKVTKSKHVGHRDKRIRYRKTVSDDEESLTKNAELLDQQDSGETNTGLHFGRLETLGSHGELGSKERRNYAENSDRISEYSKLEQSTDDREFNIDECVLGISEIRLLENSPEVIIKSLADVAINSDDEDETVAGVDSEKIGARYLQENPNEEVTVGRVITSQPERSHIITHGQRSSDFQCVGLPTSAETATKADTFVHKSDPRRQPEHGRQVKAAIKRISKKRWKRTKKSKNNDAEKETVPIQISRDKDSEIVEILEMDEDERRQTKLERRKKRRKRAKKMAKTAGLTIWKGIREGWKLMWSGLAMYTLPLGSLDVSTNIAKVWSAKTTQ